METRRPIPATVKVRERLRTATPPDGTLYLHCQPTEDTTSLLLNAADFMYSADLPRFRHLSYQYDPEWSQNRLRLTKLRDDYKRQLIQLRKKLGKQAFEFIVRSNRRVTRGWIRVRPYALRQEPSKEVVTWEKHYAETRLVSEYEFFSYLIREYPNSPHVVKWKARVSYWERNPQIPRTPSRYLKLNPYYIRRTLFPAGYFGTRYVPVKEYKAYPITNWSKVAQAWARRKRRLLPEIRRLEAAYLRVQSQLRQLYAGRYVQINHCLEDSDWSEIALPNSMTTTLPLPPPISGAIDPEWATVRSWYSMGADAYTTRGGTPCLVRITRHAATTAAENYIRTHGLLDSAVGMPALRYYGDYALYLQPFIAVGTSRVLIAKYAHPYDPAPEDYWSYDEEFAPATGSSLIELPSVIRDVDPRSHETKEAELQELLITRNTALRALNLRDDAVEFNLTRSLLELKDTPATVKSGRDFIRFLQRTESYPAVAVAFRHGPMKILHENALSPAQRRVLSMRKPPSSVLRSVGLRRISRVTLRRSSTLKTLAGLYLAWKFAIEPAVGDVQTVLRNGKEYTFAIRRGLAALARHGREHHLDVLKVRKRVILLTHMSSSPRINPRKKPTYVELNIPVHFDKKCTWHFSLSQQDFLSAHGALRILIGGHSWPYVQSDDSALRILHPYALIEFERIHGEPPDQQLLVSVLLELHRHNLHVVVDSFKEHGLAVVTYIREVLSGCLFAHVSSETVRKALDPGRFANIIAAMHPIQTAWELLPLSFVVDWVSNSSRVAQATNDLLNAKLSNVQPGPIWESIASEWYASQPSVPEYSMTSSVEPDESVYALSVFQTTEDLPLPEQARLRMVRIVPTGFTLGLRIVSDLEQSARVMYKTHIRRYTRQPVVGLPAVPWPKVRLNITAGKAGSLLAMILGGS